MSTSDMDSGQELTERLRTLGASLREMEKEIEAGRRVDTVVLRDFRAAVDNIRKTSWVVQQWLEKQAQKSDPYPLLPLLAEERIRRATELCLNLASDLEAMEITYEAEGLRELSAAVAALYKPLAPLYKKG